MKLKSFLYNSINYDISHLAPFVHEFVIEAVFGKPAQVFLVLVEFTMHCFTVTRKDGDDENLFYSHDRDGTERMFNLKRWELSRELPEIIRTLSQRQVRFTHHDNFVTVPLVLHDGTTVEYEVYFKVFRAGKKLFLEVESAYVREENFPNKRSSGRKIGFNVILQKVFRGESLSKLK